MSHGRMGDQGLEGKRTTRSAVAATEVFRPKSVVYTNSRTPLWLTIPTIPIILENAITSPGTSHPPTGPETPSRSKRILCFKPSSSRRMYGWELMKHLCLPRRAWCRSAIEHLTPLSLPGTHRTVHPRHPLRSVQRTPPSLFAQRLPLTRRPHRRDPHSLPFKFLSSRLVQL